MRDTERVPGTHSPEKKINLLFLDLSWLASPGPESTQCRPALKVKCDFMISMCFL